MKEILNLIYGNGHWEGTIQLDYWNSFFQKDLLISLNVGGDKNIEDINEYHILGYNYLLKNQETILNTILNMLFNEYTNMQDEYGYDDDEKAEFMPNIIDKSEFGRLMLPHRIYILDTIYDSIPYIGYHFTCSWDCEHDFGIMLLKNDIVTFGGADSSFMTWIAENHKNTELGIERMEDV